MSISLLCKAPVFGAGPCIKMKHVVDDNGIGKFRVRRAQCSSSAKLLCAKEGNPGTGFNTVVIDLLFDFKTCPKSQTYYRFALIYYRVGIQLDSK